MAHYKNHLIDPHFFYDAIEEFAFDYDIYVDTGTKMDDAHRLIHSYEKQSIRGSLQTQGLSHTMSKKGNIEEQSYNFYCKSLYRIDIDDFIFYKGIWLKVESIHEYDEWGVREASLKMVQLSAYRDLADYVKYLEGEKIV